jgi:hypothetical protein
VQGGTPTGKGDSGAGVEGKKGDANSWHTPIAKKGTKNKNSPQGTSNEDGQNNKKPRSDNEESAGEKSNKNKSEKEKEQAGFAVDLKSMSALMKKKSQKPKQPNKRRTRRNRRIGQKRQNRLPRRRQPLSWPNQKKQARRRTRKRLLYASNV